MKGKEGILDAGLRRGNRIGRGCAGGHLPLLLPQAVEVGDIFGNLGVQVGQGVGEGDGGLVERRLDDMMIADVQQVLAAGVGGDAPHQVLVRTLAQRNGVHMGAGVHQPGAHVVVEEWRVLHAVRQQHDPPIVVRADRIQAILRHAETVTDAGIAAGGQPLDRGLGAGAHAGGLRVWQQRQASRRVVAGGVITEADDAQPIELHQVFGVEAGRVLGGQQLVARHAARTVNHQHAVAAHFVVPNGVVFDCADHAAKPHGQVVLGAVECAGFAWRLRHQPILPGVAQITAVQDDGCIVRVYRADEHFEVTLPVQTRHGGRGQRRLAGHLQPDQKTLGRQRLAHMGGICGRRPNDVDGDGAARQGVAIAVAGVESGYDRGHMVHGAAASPHGGREVLADCSQQAAGLFATVAVAVRANDQEGKGQAAALVACDVDASNLACGGGGAAVVACTPGGYGPGGSDVGLVGIFGMGADDALLRVAGQRHINVEPGGVVDRGIDAGAILVAILQRQYRVATAQVGQGNARDVELLGVIGDHEVAESLFHCIHVAGRLGGDGGIQRAEAVETAVCLFHEGAPGVHARAGRGQIVIAKLLGVVGPPQGGVVIGASQSFGLAPFGDAVAIAIFLLGVSGVAQEVVVRAVVAGLQVVENLVLHAARLALVHPGRLAAAFVVTVLDLVPGLVRDQGARAGRQQVVHIQLDVGQRRAAIDVQVVDVQRPVGDDHLAGVVLPPGRLEVPVVDVAVDRVHQAQSHALTHAGAARGVIGVEQIGYAVAIAIGGLIQHAVAVAVNGGDAVVAVDVEVALARLVADQAWAGEGIPEGVGMAVGGIAGRDPTHGRVEEGGRGMAGRDDHGCRHQNQGAQQRDLLFLSRALHGNTSFASEHRGIAAPVSLAERCQSFCHPRRHGGTWFFYACSVLGQRQAPLAERPPEPVGGLVQANDARSSNVS